MKKQTNEQSSKAYQQRAKKPVDILDQDKGSTTRNPLHGDLSEQPEKENKIVRDNEESGQKHKSIKHHHK
ncbi:hypothetical protein ACDQ55_03900 [Chitinophaga sp. 30R24]|uniref:hypothetical protein n=1 Tax=Chitinophaga sp. 30R24 TaxID=3248838 RepID=UPI003B8F07FF